MASLTMGLTGTSREEKDMDGAKQFADVEASSQKPGQKAVYWLDMITFVVLIALAVAAGSVAASQSDNALSYRLYYPTGRFYMQGAPGWDTVMAFKEEVDSCSSRKMFIESGDSTKWNNVSFPLIYVPTDAGELRPWGYTISVLTLSALFALIRWGLSYKSILPLYNPLQPDFLRWLEYLITSPMIVVLVSVASGVRDVYTLLALAAAQAVLMLLGYLIELLIRDAWDLLYHRYSMNAAWLPHRFAVQTERRYRACERSERSKRQCFGTKQPNTPSNTSTDTTAGSSAGSSAGKACDPAADAAAQAAAQDAANQAVEKATLGPALYLEHLIRKYVGADVIHKNKFKLCLWDFYNEWAFLLTKLLLVWAVAIIDFVFIWFVIIGAFQTQADVFNNSACTQKTTDTNAVPGIVYAFVWAQFSLFALFGVAATFQVFNLWLHYNHNNKVLNKDEERLENLPDADLERQPLQSKLYEQFCDDVAKSFEEYMKDRANNFKYAAISYGILNVIAKGILGICIIWISGLNN